MESKVCTRCRVAKPLSRFGKLSKNEDGLRGQCKDCRKEEYFKSRDATLNRSRLHYIANRESKVAYARNYYQNNRDRALKQTSEYKSNKRRTDPVFSYQCGISRQLRLNLTLKKVYTKASRMYVITGLTGRELINHLHSTFELNYGLPRECINLADVEIDHIIPLSTAKTVEDVIRLNHYTNLQLLFKEDNQAKGSKHGE